MNTVPNTIILDTAKLVSDFRALALEMEEPAYFVEDMLQEVIECLLDKATARFSLESLRFQIFSSKFLYDQDPGDGETVHPLYSTVVHELGLEVFYQLCSLGCYWPTGQLPYHFDMADHPLVKNNIILTSTQGIPSICSLSKIYQ